MRGAVVAVMALVALGASCREPLVAAPVARSGGQADDSAPVTTPARPPARRACLEELVAEANARAKAAEGGERGETLVSADGRTRVVLPKEITGNVASYDVATGRALGEPTWDRVDLAFDRRFTRFLGDTFLLGTGIEPSAYTKGFLFDPRTWKELASLEEIAGLTPLPLSGTRYAFVRGRHWEGAPDVVERWDVATGKRGGASVELPFSSYLPRVVELAPGEVLVVPFSWGDEPRAAAVVDLVQWRLAPEDLPPRCGGTGRDG